MDKAELLKRISINPAVMVGKPVIKGTRLTVQYILGLLAQGSSVEDVIEEYDGLIQEDIQACFEFASEALDDNTFVPLKSKAS